MGMLPGGLLSGWWLNLGAKAPTLEHGNAESDQNREAVEKYS